MSAKAKRPVEVASFLRRFEVRDRAEVVNALLSLGLRHYQYLTDGAASVLEVRGAADRVRRTPAPRGASSLLLADAAVGGARDSANFRRSLEGGSFQQGSRHSSAPAPPRRTASALSRFLNAKRQELRSDPGCHQTEIREWRGRWISGNSRDTSRDTQPLLAVSAAALQSSTDPPGTSVRSSPRDISVARTKREYIDISPKNSVAAQAERPMPVGRWAERRSSSPLSEIPLEATSASGNLRDLAMKANNTKGTLLHGPAHPQADAKTPVDQSRTQSPSVELTETSNPTSLSSGITAAPGTGTRSPPHHPPMDLNQVGGKSEGGGNHGAKAVHGQTQPSALDYLFDLEQEDRDDGAGSVLRRRRRSSTPSQLGGESSMSKESAVTPIEREPVLRITPQFMKDMQNLIASCSGAHLSFSKLLQKLPQYEEQFHNTSFQAFYAQMLTHYHCVAHAPT